MLASEVALQKPYKFKFYLTDRQGVDAGYAGLLPANMN
jgi:hypothetical protein